MKNMKKLDSLFVTFFLLFSLSLAAFAVPQADPAERIYDYAGLLTASEEQKLREQAAELSRTTGFDTAVVLTADNEGLSSADYADDFYDYNGFGENGVLFLVNMEDRELWISTCGSAISYFTDSIIDDLTYDLAQQLGDGDYAGAAESFLSRTEKILSAPPKGQTTTMTDAPPPVQPAPKDHFWETVGMAAMVGLAFGGIVAGILAATHNSLPNKTQSTMNYVSDGRIHLTANRDIFLNSSLRKVRIQQNPPPGGGGGSHSSVHTGSSGRVHGGGGRKF